VSGRDGVLVEGVKDALYTCIQSIPVLIIILINVLMPVQQNRTTIIMYPVPTVSLVYTPFASDVDMCIFQFFR